MVTISPLNITADRGKQVTFSCSATGIAANSFTYGWLLNGVPVSGEESSSLVATASEDNTGDYQCTVRNKYGGFNQSSVATLILSKYTHNMVSDITYIIYSLRSILLSSDSKLYWIQCYME